MRYYCSTMRGGGSNGADRRIVRFGFNSRPGSDKANHLNRFFSASKFHKKGRLTASGKFRLTALPQDFAGGLLDGGSKFAGLEHLHIAAPT